MTKIGDIIGDRYRIESPLGQGGMATVYRGTDILNGQTIAVKLLKPEVIQADPDIVARFDREGEALRRLNHPSIVKVLATVVEDDNHYVVLEYVGGGDLRDLIEEQRRKSDMLPIARVMEIALDLSDALTRAHRLKIIHRDIKPANVLLAEDGTPRLTDFGVAHFSDGTRVTQTGEMIGTLAYLSPEAILGEKSDARADIWAFGVLCYELLTLRRPFDEYSTGALLNAIVSKPPDSLQSLRPDSPPALNTLIEQMLVKDPQKRINSARLIGAQLEAIISGKEIPATLDDANPTDSKLPKVALSQIMDDLKTITPPTGGYPPPPSVDTGERIPDSMYPEDASSLRKSATSTRASSPTVEIPAAPPARVSRLVLIGLGGIGLLIAVIVIFVLMNSSNNADSGASGSQSAGIFQVEPVAAGEFMVLVADFEATNGTTRDNPARFILEDLSSTFESIPFSNIQVRAYPRVITSAAEALEIAEANHAPAIFWGRYDDITSRAEIQLGSLANFPEIVIDRADIMALTDVSLNLNDASQQSLAFSAITVQGVLGATTGDGYGIARAYTTLAELNPSTAPEMTGNSIAARWHRYYITYLTNSEQALLEADESIALDARNPLLYIGRSALRMRLGDLDAALEDGDTAQRLAPENWATPFTLRAIVALFFTQDMEAARDAYLQLALLRPTDWFPPSFGAYADYFLKDFEATHTNLDLAFSLNPQANFPYIIATTLALREGQLTEAQRLFKEVFERFPDPTLSSRIFLSLYGQNNAITSAAEAFGAATLRQWRQVINAVGAGTTLDNDFYDVYLPDVFLLEGIAYCNLGDYAAAEISYTRLIDHAPDYIMGYALRGEVRREQGDLIGAAQDGLTVTQSDQAALYAPYMGAFLSGEINCTNFLDVDLSVYNSETTPEATAN